MAIYMMTGADKADQPNVETVTNYPGSEITRVHHDYNCGHYRDNTHEASMTRYADCHERCRNFDPLYIETTHVGCVLSTYERNGYDDSDFYAVVWNDEQGKPQHICYATTRGWTYPNGAVVDATPEVLAKYEAWQRKVSEDKRREDDVRQAKMPYKGRAVEVTSGRKVKIGTIATVFWFGEDKYRSTRYDNPMADALGLHKYNASRYRIGIEWVESGSKRKEFIPAQNVTVVNPDQYLSSN